MISANFKYLNFKKLDNKAVTPTRGSDYAAGLDLYARIEHNTVTAEQPAQYVLTCIEGFDDIVANNMNATEIPPAKTAKIGTGIAVEIPKGYFGAIFARSGLATKQGLRPANAVGVVDADYRGEIVVALHNDSDKTRVIHDGDRIAQLVIIPYLELSLNEVEELSDTVRGSGGFGSTGT